MTGLPVDQILKFGELAQGDQQLRNQSSAAITENLYKQALGKYYNEQSLNRAEEIKQKGLYNQEKLLLEALANQYEAIGDLAQAAKYRAEAAQKQQQINAFAAGQTPAQITAATGQKRLSHDIGIENTKLTYENARTQADRARLELEEAREERLSAKTDADIAKAETDIQVAERKMADQVANTVSLIDENKDNEIAAKGFIDLYNKISSDDETSLYWYDPDSPGWDSEGVAPIRIPTEDGGFLTMADIRRDAKANKVSPIVVIEEYAKLAGLDR